MPRNMLSPDSKRTQRKIVAYHNYFRAHVKPNAANMLEMVTPNVTIYTLLIRQQQSISN